LPASSIELGGADAVCDCDDRAQDTLVLAPLAEGDDVGDDGLGNGHEPAATDAGDGAKGVELDGGLG
jgi:hypothetical protein